MEQAKNYSGGGEEVAEPTTEMAAKTTPADMKGDNTVTVEYDRTKPLPCPMCSHGGTKKKLSKPFPYIDFDKCKVKVGDEFQDYECNKDYVRNNYTHLETDTYKVPAVFSYFHKEGATNYDFKRDDELKTKQEITEVLIDRRQKEAVEVVARAIYQWGKKKSEPMFVISEYKFTDFLGNIHMYDEGKSKYDKVIKHKKINLGDHDIFVIMKRGELVFVQVKSIAQSSGLKTRRGKLKHALEQANKDKVVVQDINGDLPFVKNLKMVGLVAVPNLTDGDLRKVNVCSTHHEETLTGSLLLDEESFDQWWEDRLGEAPPTDMTVIQYTDLLRKYVGLGSIVHYRTAAHAIHKTFGSVHGYGFVKLNPQQQEVMTEESIAQRKKILLGDFGTGKSLLLVRKAEQLAKRGDHVYIISFSVVSDGSGKVFNEYDNCVEHLEQMKNKVLKKSKDHRSNKELKGMSNRDMMDKDDDNDIGSKFKVRSFYQQLTEVGLKATSKFLDHTKTLPYDLSPEIVKEVMENTVSRDGKNIHFFLDELPLCLGERGWKEFEEFCNAHPKMYVWISIAVCSYALKKNEDYGSLENSLPRSFTKSSLTRCMRMPRNGFNLVQAVRKFKDDGHDRISECGTVIDGPKPKWYELPPCSCEAGPSYSCHCIGKNRIRDILEKIITRELYGETPKEVVIIMHDTVERMTQCLSKAVDKACKELKLSYNYKGSTSGNPRYSTQHKVDDDLEANQFEDENHPEEKGPSHSNKSIQSSETNATEDATGIEASTCLSGVEDNSRSEYPSAILETSHGDSLHGTEEICGNANCSDPPSVPLDEIPTVTNNSTSGTDGSRGNSPKINSINRDIEDSRGVSSDNMKVTLVDFWSYKGSESAVVIYLDPYGGPIVRTITSRWAGYQDVAGTLARSLAQIVYVTWPQEEQEWFLTDFLEKVKEYGTDAKAKEFWLGIANQAERKDGKGSFMDYLVKEGVITKIMYKADEHTK